MSLKNASLLFLICLKSVVAIGDTNLEAAWANFKSRYGKAYKNEAQEAIARHNWQINHNMITDHNHEAMAGRHLYTLDENRFCDLNASQLERMAGARPELAIVDERVRLDDTELAAMIRQDTPESVDYRNSACMNPVRNQVQLSEQHLVDCSSSYGNWGCGGGWYYNAWRYIQKAPGQSQRHLYPYNGGAYSCRYNDGMSGGTVSSWKHLPAGDEEAMKSALAIHGPVSVAMHSKRLTFMYYKEGIYSDPACSHQIDHAVVLVGYGTLNDRPYWVVRNSWGTEWGLGGYFLLLRGVNQCGIANHAAYPVV